MGAGRASHRAGFRAGDQLDADHRVARFGDGDVRSQERGRIRPVVPEVLVGRLHEQAMRNEVQAARRSGLLSPLGGVCGAARAMRAIRGRAGLTMAFQVARCRIA